MRFQKAWDHCSRAAPNSASGVSSALPGRNKQLLSIGHPRILERVLNRLLANHFSLCGVEPRFIDGLSRGVRCFGQKLDFLLGLGQPLQQHLSFAL